MNMRRLLLCFFVATVACVSASEAGELGIHVILSGEVAPGVYGQVQLGNEGPPPVVYAQPLLIESRPMPPPPVYLHVPPGHARNWRRFCRDYNACDRPVYFVRSEEYAPDYVKRHRHHDDEDDDHGHGRDHGHGHGHDQERHD